MTRTSFTPTHLRVMIAATVGNMVGITAAVHSVFGTFLIPLTHAFGWQRASVSVVLGIISLAGAIIYPLAGVHADRHGARPMLLLGNAGLAGAIALLALSSGSLAQFYATFTLIAVLGALVSAAAFAKIVSDWFDDNRGTMLGISGGLGNGIGATVMPILAAVLVAHAGWRVAYLGVAAVVLVVGFPALFWGVRDAPRGRDRPEDAHRGEGLTLAQAARTPVFWLIFVAIASGAGCTTAIFSHVVPILAERGVTLGIATSVISVFALVTAAWQIGMGVVLDRTSGPRIVAPLYLIAASGLALVELGHGTVALLAGGALLGIGLGTQFGALPFLLARYFGLRAFGTIVGTMYSGVILAQGATPILLDHAFDLQGTYRHALLVIGVCLVLGALLLVMLPRYRHAAVAA